MNSSAPLGSPVPQPLDLPRLRNETFVADVVYHVELASTNTTAAELARDAHRPLPLLVITERQTAGRGRGENRWWSADGALTFSLVLETMAIPTERLPQISLTTGLAICQALEQLVPTADVALKWPNDIYLQGRKVGGILIELPPARPPRLVIGIGLNVNNSLESAPADVQARAIALRDVLQWEQDRTTVLIACLQQLQHCLQALVDRPATLPDLWRSYCLLQGRHVRLDAYSRQIQGRCRGIDDEGALLIEHQGSIERALGGVVLEFC